MKFERVQVLRFVAAAAVVLFHAQGTAAHYRPVQSENWLIAHGDRGVDLFFVISGLIIRHTISRREQSAALFLRRRAERIVPLYWLCTGAFLALLLLSPAARGPVDGHAVLARFALSLTFLAWTAAPAPFPLVYVGWSLEYEVLFYLLAAACLLRTRKLALPLAIGLAVPILVGRLIGAEGAGPALRFVCNPILIEFLFGVLIADILAGERPYAASAIAFAALLTISPAGWGLRVWSAGVPSAMLVAIAAVMDRRGMPLGWSTRFLAKLGDASYSIYLVQVFTISAVCKVVARIAPQLPTFPLILLTGTISVAAGYAVFIIAERPMLRLTHRLDKATRDRRNANQPTGEIPAG